MREEDRPAFVGLILSLAESYRRDASEPLIQGYWIGLEDYSLTDVKNAIRTALKESAFMPSPAELGTIIQDHYRRMSGLKSVRESTVRRIQDTSASGVIRAARERLGLTEPVRGRAPSQRLYDPEAGKKLKRLVDRAAMSMSYEAMEERMDRSEEAERARRAAEQREIDRAMTRRKGEE